MIRARAGLLVVLLAAGCANNPPSVPTVFGPGRCRPGETITFAALSADADADSLSYYFQWSGGPESGWTGWYAAGTTAHVAAGFADSGDFWLVVKSRDSKEAESDWSDSSHVAVRDYGPHVPRRPSGPDTARVGVEALFGGSGRHPLGEVVALQFRWGDSLGAWSAFVPQETLVLARFAFTATGWHEVRCRARDMGERLSGWSAPDSVLVIDTFRYR